jgi:hypothetical protein
VRIRHGPNKLIVGVIGQPGVDLDSYGHFRAHLGQ